MKKQKNIKNDTSYDSLNKDLTNKLTNKKDNLVKDYNYIDIAKQVGSFLQNKNAKKIEIYDVSKKTNLMKIMIFTTVSNKENCKDLAMELISFMHDKNYPLLHVDGLLKGEWIVLDFNIIVVHFFNNAQRIKYNLEKLWKDSNNSISFN